jgi:hypothetical protein
MTTAVTEAGRRFDAGYAVQPDLYPLSSCRAITIRWIWLVPS